MRRNLSDSRQRHRPVGSAAECGGLEDLPYVRRIDNASHLSPGLLGTTGDKLQDQVSSGVAFCGFPSKCDPNFFKELLPLRRRKIHDQSSEARQ
jgi:hypothetical protein